MLHHYVPMRLSRFAGALTLVGALLSPGTMAQGQLGIDTDAMDRSVRPQDDLFEYTNGAWLKTVEMPADRNRYGSFDLLRERSEDQVRAIIEDVAAGRVDDPDAARIGAIYTAYMDSARVEALGVAPLAPDMARIDAVGSTAGLMAYFAENAKGFGPSPVSGFVGVDRRNSEVNAFYLSQSGTGLPDRSYYLEDRFADARAGYQTYLERIATLAEMDDPAGLAQAVLALETRLAEAQWTRVQNRDPEATYNKMAVADVVAAYPSLHLDRMMATWGVAGRVDSVIVRQPTYFTALDAIVAETPLAVWQQYARVRTVSEAAGLLPAAFGEAQFAFFGQTLSGQEADRPRWKKAVSATSGTFGESVGRIYVARHYPAEARARMEELIGNLREAFRQSIERLDWMTPATRAEALKKLASYTYKIGHPDAWEPYAGLEASPTDLVGNARRSAAWRYADRLSDLGQPVDRTEWGMTPQTVNAYYNAAFNEIVFPAAILQPPFFNVEADDAVNYGGIGAVIGHEFSHGFDDTGSQYDADGNLRSWWTPEDRTEFERRADQIVAQYETYRPFPGDSTHVNGRLTLGENIADLAGLTMAYRAYQLSLDTNGDGTVSADEQAPVIDGVTGDQRFFLGWAQVWRITHREPYLRQLLQVDTHSPGQYRANGPLPHLDGFYSAFDVQPGDALYVAPEDRIVLW